MNGSTMLRLGDVVKPVQDKHLERTEWNFDKYVAGEHIESGKIRIRNYGLVEGNEEVIGPAFHMRFKPGHVLYSTRRAYLRKAGMVDFEGICSNVTLVLQADEEKLFQSLLPFILQSEDFVQYAISHSIGSTNPFVKWSDLSKYRVKIPPLDTQKKMSQLFWTIEDHVERTENLIKAAEKFKKGLLERLLTKGTDHKRFKKTEFGEIPQEWSIEILGEVAEVNDGSHFSPPSDPEGRHIIATVKDMKEDRFDIDACKRISDDQYMKLREEGNVAKKGDVLFSKDGTIGQVFVYEDDYAIPLLSSIAMISPSERLSSDYLCEIFKSEIFFQQLEVLQSGTAIRRIVLKSLKKLRIPVPDTIEEQKKISQLAKEVDGSIKKQKLSLGNLTRLRRKLTNSFISGELDFPKEATN